MNLVLTPEMQEYVEGEVRSGRFRSADEVVQAALTVYLQRERLARLPPDELDAVFPGIRERIATGLAEARAGRVSDGEAFFESLEQEDGSESDPTRRSA